MSKVVWNRNHSLRPSVWRCGAFPILGQTYIHFPLPKSLFYTGLIPNIIPRLYLRKETHITGWYPHVCCLNPNLQHGSTMKPITASWKFTPANVHQPVRETHDSSHVCCHSISKNPPVIHGSGKSTFPARHVWKTRGVFEALWKWIDHSHSTINRYLSIYLSIYLYIYIYIHIHT